MNPLARRYVEVRRATEDLAAGLSPEDCQVQSMPDASPTKWHLAHTSWFFETFVLGGRAPYDARFGYLFNSYYESLGARVARGARGLLTRPSLGEVRDYRRHVDGGILRLLEAGDVDDATAARIVLGLHHEQQHQELILTDVKHALGSNPLLPAYRAAAPSGPGVAPSAPAPPVGWVEHAGGVVEIGHAGPGPRGEPFAFDNESPRHRVVVEPFRLADRLVTAGEYLAFIHDGGYRRPELWLSDGWAAARAGAWTAPLYWRERDGTFAVFTLDGVTPLEAAAPVEHVSYYEADAYARWAGVRLPTEAEWEVVAGPGPIEGNFLESGALRPRPHPVSTRAAHPSQLFGDAWEWTRSPYVPYPGFRPAAGALGEYNGKFMCNQVVLRGGSCLTPRTHMRATYRNFFPPDARWQMTGIRLAADG
jgi:ergothioneine biosynthesis protein EgtB